MRPPRERLQLLDLIDRLTGGDEYPSPVTGCDESASCPMTCHFCGAEAAYADRGYRVTHEDDCAWVEARRLLGKPTE